MLPPANALDGPEGDQLIHRLAHPRQHRPHQEHRDSAQEKRLPAIQVRQPPHDRHRRRRSHQVRRRHPRKPVKPAQVRNDPRHRRAHHRLIQRRQEDRQHQPTQRKHHLPPRQRRWRRRVVLHQPVCTVELTSIEPPVTGRLESGARRARGPCLASTSIPAWRERRMLPAPCPCDVSQGLRTYEPFLRTNPGQRRQRGHELGARKLQIADWNVDHNRGLAFERAWKQVFQVLRIVRPQSDRSE